MTVFPFPSSLIKHSTSIVRLQINPRGGACPKIAVAKLHRQSLVTMTESTDHPLSGFWKPTHLQGLHYGPSSVQTHLVSALPSSTSKAFIVTGSSLATKTSLIRQVEKLLGPERHAGTFSTIRQHAPIAQLDEAAKIVAEDSSIDTIISIGGGSPIDSAKVISYRCHEKLGKFLHHITVPTTLSAAECTFFGGYTKEDGVKASTGSPETAPHVILYDSKYALETPPALFLSTGIRSLDHSVELLYHASATEVPAKQLALTATAGLFTYLPKYKANPKDEENITRLQLAAFSSLFPLGVNIVGGIGLSHSLGYALGSPYGIPHGITSCLTLASVVKLKANNPEEAEQIARILPFIGQHRSGNDKEDAIRVGDAIAKLVKELGLETNLTKYNVGEDQNPKIVKLATKTAEGKLYDNVSALVKRII